MAATLRYWPKVKQFTWSATISSSASLFRSTTLMRFANCCRSVIRTRPRGFVLVESGLRLLPVIAGVAFSAGGNEIIRAVVSAFFRRLDVVDRGCETRKLFVAFPALVPIAFEYLHPFLVSAPVR